MIQAAMYFALGLLAAGVLALLVAPAIWRRAARLTRQRIESSLPMTVAEIQADKDQLRAEFAMTARRLEMTVDRLRDKAADQTVEINEKRAEIVRLTNDRNDKSEQIAELEQRTAGLLADIEAANARLEKADTELEERRETLAARESALADLQARFDSEQALTDALKLEVVARNTEIGNLNDQIADGKAVQESIAAERDRLMQALADEQATLAAERQRIANLEASLARIETERVERLEELERRATEARDLSAELAKSRARAEDLTAQASELEADRDRLRAQIEQHTATTEALRRDLAERADGDNTEKAIAAAEAETAALATRLAGLEADHEALRAENEELRRVAGADWNVESENKLLRERLASVAADVMRLSGAAGDAPATAGGASDKNGNGTDDQTSDPIPLRRPSSNEGTNEAGDDDASEPVEGKTLAERLRALQHTAAQH